MTDENGATPTLDKRIQRRIPILVYDDIEAAYKHLVNAFGLGAGVVERDSDGRAIHAEVQAGDGVIWLHRVAPEHGLASPRTVGASTGMTAVMVDDVDAHYEHVQSLTGQSIGRPSISCTACASTRSPVPKANCGRS